MKTTVFPIVTYNPETEKWKCLGTGFFISPVGAFITAKHLFMDSDNKMESTLLGIQNVNDKEYHVRSVKKLIAHKNSDIIIGILGKRRIKSKDVEPELSKYSVLDLEPLENGDEIYTYSYPNTLSEDLVDNAKEFTFTGTFSKGKVIDYHENGSPVVRNRCYQTNMKIDSGASGGPVFKKGYIVGVNSSSFSLSDDDEPISFITPIDYILDLIVEENGKKISVRELIKNGFIKTKDNVVTSTTPIARI
jgi:S1-C subfamily serine protease